MKKYTLEDMKNFERDDYGFLICPSGDYTEISSFGERCRFGEECRFGAGCRFGERCSFGAGCSCENGRVFKAVVSFEGAGRERRKTYCFLLEDNTIFVRCGCFSGTESAFIEKVHKTHAGTPHEDVYLSFFDAAKKALQVIAKGR